MQTVWLSRCEFNLPKLLVHAANFRFQLFTLWKVRNQKQLSNNNLSDVTYVGIQHFNKSKRSKEKSNLLLIFKINNNFVKGHVALLSN